MSRVRHQTIVRVLFAGVLGLAVAMPFAQAASAQDDSADASPEDAVVLTGRLQVPEGVTVGTAVMFNGPVLIQGTVAESLVVFNGRTEIFGTVEGDVMVFNGRVIIRPGAHVGGDVFSRSVVQVEPGATVDGEIHGIAQRFDLWKIGLIGRFAWWLGYSISTLILGLLLLWLAPRLDGRISAVVNARFGASAGLGAAAFFLLPIAAVLLIVVIVALPLGLFLLLAGAFLYTLGYVAGAAAIGALVVKPPTSRVVRFLAGWGILRGLALIPFVGGLIWMLATILGFGVLIIAARSETPQEVPPAVPPPPAPAVA
jgi:hypothetical protein